MHRTHQSLNGATVLDFGCGTGLLSERLVAAGAQVYALDTSPVMLESLNAKNDLFASGNVEANTNLPSPTRRFDLVVCSSVCAFVDDYPGTVADLVSRLEPNGWFIQWDWERTTADERGLTEHQIRTTLENANLIGIDVDVDVDEAFNIEFEGMRMAPLMDREFVELVYLNVLGRSADQAGADFWTAALGEGTSRGEVMVGFGESTEFIEATNTSTPVFDPAVASINRLYKAVLGRDGDDGGLTFWYDVLRNGGSLTDVANELTESQEFRTTYGALSDDQFVALVYENVLGRQPDSAGLKFWTTQLNGGLSRGTMMIAFSESVEYVVATDSLPPR